MPRFLLAAAGSLGDLHPYIAVGRELVRRGHEVVIASTPEYRAPVESAGVAFAPIGPTFESLGDYRAVMQRAFHPRRGVEFMVREIVMPNVRRLYDDLSPLCADADLLVSHPLTVSLPLVAAILDKPWVSTVLAPLSLMSAHDPPVLAMAPWFHRLRVFGPAPHRWLYALASRRIREWEAPLRALRHALGLPPSPQVAMLAGQFSPHGNLALFDGVLAASQSDWPRHTTVCGAALYDGTQMDEAARTELDAFLAAGAPPIVFALGSSAVWIAGDFWERAIAAARALDRRAIFLTGPATLQGLPDTMRQFAYVPYSAIFGRAAAIVHQAGIGTLSQAMRAGKPQLIVPVSFDQPDNAHRAAALGLGRVVPFGKATAARLASELGALLSEPRCADAARSVATQLAASDGASRAADALVACLDRHAARISPKS